MRIVLASESERRRDILKVFIENFQIIKSNSGEEYNQYFDLLTNIMSISRNKANSIGAKCDDIVIGADTAVVLDNILLGKPKNREEAKIFLTSLSGKTHKVITSFYISCKEKSIYISDYVESSVKFFDLHEDLIESYLNTMEWQGKAGAYAIQGKGTLFVESIRGDYLSIVGFPISKIAYYLRKYLSINIMEEAYGI